MFCVYVAGSCGSWWSLSPVLASPVGRVRCQPIPSSPRSWMRLFCYVIRYSSSRTCEFRTCSDSQTDRQRDRHSLRTPFSLSLSFESDCSVRTTRSIARASSPKPTRIEPIFRARREGCTIVFVFQLQIQLFLLDSSIDGQLPSNFM